MYKTPPPITRAPLKPNVIAIKRKTATKNTALVVIKGFLVIITYTWT